MLHAYFEDPTASEVATQDLHRLFMKIMFQYSWAMRIILSLIVIQIQPYDSKFHLNMSLKHNINAASRPFTIKRKHNKLPALCYIYFLCLLASVYFFYFF